MWCGSLQPEWRIEGHCRTRRRLHGSYGAYSNTDLDTIIYEEQYGLSWFLSTDTGSKKVMRGFCNKCGASRFWHIQGTERIAIAAGSNDKPTGLHTMAHIWIREKADFYTITDDLPQHFYGLPKT